MRRKIELYINGTLADLSDQGLVLFNYSLTDLQKPTAVKNGFSKQITLPGTPQNDFIFGHIERTDRVTTVSTFNTGKRSEFAIYDEKGQILESGYLRLDSLVRRGSVVTGYKVSLFGGLGAFFYALSYDDAGNKRTLADIDYLGKGDPTELDFTIRASTVQGAWDTRAHHNWQDPITNIWHVLNFAPAYNGYPSGDFSPDKGIVTAADVGLPASVTEDGKTWAANNGTVLVNLAKSYDEWAVKDLRCYLQRPVLNMRAFVEAVMRPENNGGYTVDFPDMPVKFLNDLWKTLPTLPSLGDFKKREGQVLATFVPDSAGHASAETHVGDINVNRGSIPENAQTQVTANIGATFTVASTASQLSLHASQNYGGSNRNFQMKDTFLFMQLVAYGSDNTIVGGSAVKCITASSSYYTPKEAAAAAGFVPVYPAGDYEPAVIILENVTRVSENTYRLPDQVFQVKADNVHHYEVFIKAYEFRSHTWVVRISSRERYYYQLDEVVGGTSACPVLFASYNDFYQTSTTMGTRDTSTSISISYTTTSILRSGSYITKDLLLQSKYTPAEYILSLAKMYGMYFICDPAEKKVTVLSRNAFFNTGKETIDLTKRIDTSQDITITPQVFASKWYTMEQNMALGAWAEEYAKVYGVNTGVARIDTGYDFDAADVELMDSTIFRMAATILDAGPYYNWLLVNGQFRPSPFIDPGHTYTMWSTADGSSKEFQVPGLPSSVEVHYLNEHGHEGSDVEFSAKLDLRTADGSEVDGVDILCLCLSADHHPYYKLSDDSAAMTAANGNKPCWDLNPGTEQGISIPNFHRFNDYGETWEARFCIDFGLPREWKIPIYHIYGIDDSVGSDEEKVSVYARFWRSYLRDLLDKDTKVMTCRVNLEGLQVGPQLLRRFFWYDNSLWVLNKITNYSLTTYDPAECEFVQVRNIENYTNGQIWTW